MKCKTFFTLFFCALTVVQLLPANAKTMYKTFPGTDQYVVGSPLFNKVTLTMENGRQFVIEARNNSADNVYIQSATLNGISLERNYITYSNITAGGHLVFKMGAQPALHRCTGKAAAPFSLSKINY